MQLGEMAHVHIKKLLGRPLLPMAYAVNGAHPLQGNDTLFTLFPITGVQFNQEFSRRDHRNKDD